MNRILSSVTFRLAVGYGTLAIGAMVMISAVLYFETVGVLSRGINAKLFTVSERLSSRFERDGMEGVARYVSALLTDSIDEDTEVYLLLDADGRKIVGNLTDWNGAGVPFDQLSDQVVSRYGHRTVGRVLPHRLPNGGIFVVGREMSDLREIGRLVMRGLAIGGGLTLVLAIGGVFLFRRELEQRIAAIRRTALEIEAGDLSRRIPVPGMADEFTRLSSDINHMLDRIQHLMEGVRDVSNAIAHDLRTPLCRIRGTLEEALLSGANSARLSESAGAAIRGIDELIDVFDKLLQIAEAESGTRRQSFQMIPLRDVVTDVVELYDATAEAKSMALLIEIDGEPMTIGDKDLLRSATANLIDNALKYGGHRAKVLVRATQERGSVSIIVEDNGPGIPSAELAKVVTRFYRLDRSRSMPGNGLGLPIVAAISNLHGGKFSLDDAHPGLIARIVLPSADAAARPDGDMPHAPREVMPAPARHAFSRKERRKIRA